VSELSKSENEIYSLRKEKEENIKSSNLESFTTSFKNSTNINLLHQNHSNIEDGAKTDISVSVRGRILGIRSFGKLTFLDLSPPYMALICEMVTWDSSTIIKKSSGK